MNNDPVDHPNQSAAGCTGLAPAGSGTGIRAWTAEIAGAADTEMGWDERSAADFDMPGGMESVVELSALAPGLGGFDNVFYSPFPDQGKWCRVMFQMPGSLVPRPVNALRLQPYQAGAARSAPTIITFSVPVTPITAGEKKPGTAHARPFEKTPHRDSASQKLRYEYRGPRVSVFFCIFSNSVTNLLAAAQYPARKN